MCSADAERDESFGCDERFARDVCLRHVSGTHHITSAAASLAAKAAYLTLSEQDIRHNII